MKQSTIVKKLRKIFGHYNVKVISASLKNEDGFYDTVIAYKGHAFFLEIKICPDKLKPLQKKFGERFKNSSLVLEYNKKTNEWKIFFDSESDLLNELANLLSLYLIYKIER